MNRATSSETPCLLILLSANGNCILKQDSPWPWDSNIWSLENFGHRRPLGTLTILTKRWLNSQLCCKCTLYFFFWDGVGGGFDHLRSKKLISFFYGTMSSCWSPQFWSFGDNRKSSHLTNISQTKAGSHLAAIEKGSVVALQVIAVPDPFAWACAFASNPHQVTAKPKFVHCGHLDLGILAF